MAPQTLTPPLLRAGATQGDVDALRAQLSARLSPCLCVEDAALAERCRAMASKASATHERKPDARQEAFQLDGDAWARLRADLTALAFRTLRTLAPDVPADLPLDARLCLRRYPPGPRGQRLGAHVDDTLCTLLWASTPGLEVLAPADDSDWTGRDVAKVGLPTTGPRPRIVEEGDWARVAPPSAGCFIFTPGNGWGGIATSVQLRSPTLHRVAVGGDVERLSLPLLVSVRGDYGSALSSVGAALGRISLEGADAAEEPDRLSPLAEIIGVGALFPHLDAVSLCRLDMCARAFGAEDPTSRRSLCEDVARERALDLMDGHLECYCKQQGVSSVRQLEQLTFCEFLAAFYHRLKKDGHRLFPHPPEGRPPRPKDLVEGTIWPKRWHSFQGWFHTLDALEAGPVAAWAAAGAMFELADRGVIGRQICGVAADAVERALLARPGEFEVIICTSDGQLGPRIRPVSHEDERIAALVTRHGGHGWARGARANGAPANSGRATFPSLRHVVDAKDALLADEAVTWLRAPGFDRFTGSGR